MIRLAYPLALLLLLALPLLWVLWLWRTRRPLVRFSSLAWLKEAGGAGARRARLILPALRTVALICLIVAVARPQRPDESSQIFAEGIAIQMVVDTSTSMTDLDLSPPNRRTTRLDIVKEVFRRFVEGDDKLPGRPNDLIGMVRFAGYADALCPLTLDHEALLDLLQSLDFAGAELLREAQRALQHAQDKARAGDFAEQRRLVGLAQRLRDEAAKEDRTAIGDGLALAVERLKDLKRTVGSGEQIKITSRVVILLTDGEHNAGTITPEQAGELAATFGIRVYTVLAGTGRLGGLGFRFPVDDRALRHIAEVTGGKFYHARNSEALRQVYADIDQLERTNVEERHYVRWGELSRPWLLAAFACVCVQTFLDATRLRRIP